METVLKKLTLAGGLENTSILVLLLYPSALSLASSTGSPRK